MVSAAFTRQRLSNAITDPNTVNTSPAAES